MTCKDVIRHEHSEKNLWFDYGEQVVGSASSIGGKSFDNFILVSCYTENIYFKNKICKK